MSTTVLAPWVVLLLGSIAVGAAGQDDQEFPPGGKVCALCHDSGPLDPEVEEGEAAPFDGAALLGSAHASLECVECHVDAESVFEEMEHAEELAPVPCGMCHGDEAAQYRESLHGEVAANEPLAPTCATCHGSHDVLPASDPASPTNAIHVPGLCGQCHHEDSEVDQKYDIPQDKILENYSLSIHGEGIFQKGLTVTAVCTSCHTAHHVLPHTDDRSSIAPGQIVATCMTCHARIEEVHTQVIKGELWETQPHVIPVCVDCHAPHEARRIEYTQVSDRDCLECHTDPAQVPVDLVVDEAELDASRHSRISCAQCHTDVYAGLDRACQNVVQKVDCSNCHPEVVDEYVTSTHGQLVAMGSPDGPSCHDCHGDHDVMGPAEVDSPIYPRNVPALCGKCHRVGEKAAVRYNGTQQNVVAHYVESIHGKGLLESGLTVTATCANCHSAHSEQPSNEPSSTVHRDNIAETCAQCHRGIYELYTESIHSSTVTETDAKLPTYSDCHSAHTINRTDLMDFRLHIMDQCGNCHEDVAESYFETYHGKVSKLGYLKTAKCYDCHGAHEILPTWNPKSYLSRDNIVETCGQCHPGSNGRFAGYLTHATHHDPDKYPLLFYTFWGMTILLIGTLFVAGLHTVAWLPRISLEFRKKVLNLHTPSGKHVQRFKPFHSKLHLMVIVSFFALALTGMALKFSYTGWARFVAWLFGGFETAGTVHRAAAIVTFAYFALHLWDVLKRKRKEAGGLMKLLLGPNTMLFTKTDGKEFIASLKWFFAGGPRPKYGRWTYWEKFDYFAVFWGVAVIGSTGLLLWFPEFFTLFLPGWALNVATIIHSDEALLAVGFIFTIHFFNTHFRPEKFPVDTVVFTGSVPLEEFKIDRPREYEELVASGELESRLVDPPAPHIERFWKCFGYSALGVGITLILLILYAAIFAYR